MYAVAVHRKRADFHIVFGEQIFERGALVRVLFQLQNVGMRLARISARAEFHALYALCGKVFERLFQRLIAEYRGKYR